jgi:hypothetical protein
VNPDTPYRYDTADGETRRLMALSIIEEDFSDKKTDSWNPRTRVVPEGPHNIHTHETIRVYHVDNPGGDWVDLTYGVGHDGMFSSGALTGPGSMLLLGELRHALEDVDSDEVSC